MKSNKKDILFSIIIPTYNRHILLKKTLDSILNLDYNPHRFELIVIDDKSDDDSMNLLESFKDHIPNYSIIQNTENKGVSFSRNTGIKESVGTILVFIDDDCIVSKNILKTLEGIYHENPEIVSCGVKITSFNEENIIARFINRFHTYGMNSGFIPTSDNKKIREYMEQPNGLSIVHGCSSSHNSIKKMILEELGGYDEQFPKAAGAEDIELNIRINERHNMYVTDEANIKHVYNTSLFKMLRQFYNYGRSGRYFRKMLDERKKTLPVRERIAYKIHYVQAISDKVGNNNLEKLIVLILTLLSELALYSGELRSIINSK